MPVLKYFDIAKVGDTVNGGVLFVNNFDHSLDSFNDRTFQSDLDTLFSDLFYLNDKISKLVYHTNKEYFKLANNLYLSYIEVSYSSEITRLDTFKMSFPGKLGKTDVYSLYRKKIFSNFYELIEAKKEYQKNIVRSNFPTIYFLD